MTYLLVALPLLAGLLILAVVSLPRVAATAVDASLVQGETMWGELRRGQLFTPLGRALHILLLGLPLLGSSLVLTRLTRRVGGGLISWSQQGVLQGLAGTTLSGLAVLGLVAAWFGVPPSILDRSGDGGTGVSSPAAFRPIQEHEQGRVGDSRFVAAIGLSTTDTASVAATPADNTPTPEGAASPSPEASAMPASTALPSRTPTTSATPTTQGATAPTTPTPNATPTPDPNAEQATAQP